MKKIVTIEVDDDEDVVDAVGEVLTQMEAGFTSGYNPYWEVTNKK